MARQVQWRRGTTAENDAYTGADGELTIDTETYGVRVHDGVTPGGHALDLIDDALRADVEGVETGLALKANIAGPTFTGNAIGAFRDKGGTAWHFTAYGATGDGTTNDRAAIALADAAALAGGGATTAGPGAFVIATNTTMAAPHVPMAGQRLKPSSGITLTFGGKITPPGPGSAWLDLSASGAFAASAGVFVDAVHLTWFYGLELGTLETLYPSHTYTQLKALRKHNAKCLQYAILLASQAGARRVILPPNRIEVHIDSDLAVPSDQVGHGFTANAIYTPRNTKLTVEGAGRGLTQVVAYPYGGRPVDANPYIVFEVCPATTDGGTDVTFKGFRLTGPDIPLTVKKVMITHSTASNSVTISDGGTVGLFTANDVGSQLGSTIAGGASAGAIIGTILSVAGDGLSCTLVANASTTGTGRQGGIFLDPTVAANKAALIASGGYWYGGSATGVTGVRFPNQYNSGGTTYAKARITFEDFELDGEFDSGIYNVAGKTEAHLRDVKMTCHETPYTHFNTAGVADVSVTFRDVYIYSAAYQSWGNTGAGSVARAGHSWYIHPNLSLSFRNVTSVDSAGTGGKQFTQSGVPGTIPESFYSNLVTSGHSEHAIVANPSRFLGCKITGHMELSGRFDAACYLTGSFGTGSSTLDSDVVLDCPFYFQPDLAPGLPTLTALFQFGTNPVDVFLNGPLLGDANSFVGYMISGAGSGSTSNLFLNGNWVDISNLNTIYGLIIANLTTNVYARGVRTSSRATRVANFLQINGASVVVDIDDCDLKGWKSSVLIRSSVTAANVGLRNTYMEGTATNQTSGGLFYFTPRNEENPTAVASASTLNLTFGWTRYRTSGTTTINTINMNTLDHLGNTTAMDTMFGGTIWLYLPASGQLGTSGNIVPAVTGARTNAGWAVLTWSPNDTKWRES